MSYILDALKKAESERSLGTVPNLHAQQPAFIAPSAGKPSFATSWRVGTGIAALLLMLVAIAWFKPWQAVPAPLPPAPAALPQQPVPALAAAAPQSAPQQALPPAAPPSPATPMAPDARTAAAAAEQPEQAAEKPVQKKPRPVPRAPEKKSAQAAASQPKAPATTRSASETGVVALHDLPQAIRSQMPALNVTGYIYSANQADRTVLINQKLLREGDHVTPDLTLETLTPTGMVLNFRGYRYRSSY